MMFKVVALLSVVVSAALAAPQHHAAQYPAGVNPQDCPNFPICDNARLHNPQAHWNAPAAPAWNHHQAAPAWQQQASSWQQPHQQQWGGDTGDSGAWHEPQQHWGGDSGNSGAWHQPAAPAAPAADKFPAGVNPHSCPNYPFCDVNAGHHGAAVAAPPLPGWSERQYPAGVSAHECPNFPYCH